MKKLLNLALISLAISPFAYAVLTPDGTETPGAPAKPVSGAHQTVDRPLDAPQPAAQTTTAETPAEVSTPAADTTTSGEKETPGRPTPHPAWFAGEVTRPAQTEVRNAKTGEPVAPEFVPDPDYRPTPQDPAPRAATTKKTTPTDVAVTTTPTADDKPRLVVPPRDSATDDSASVYSASSAGAPLSPRTSLMLRLMDPANTDRETQPRIAPRPVDRQQGVLGVVDLFTDAKPVVLDPGNLVISGIPDGQTFLHTSGSEMLVYAGDQAPSHAHHLAEQVLDIPSAGMSLTLQALQASAFTLTYAGAAPTSSTRLEHLLSFPDAGVHLWQQNSTKSGEKGKLRSLVTVSPWPTETDGRDADTHSIDSSASADVLAAASPLADALMNPTMRTWVKDIASLFQGATPIQPAPNTVVMGLPGAQLFERVLENGMALYLAYAGDAPQGHSHLQHVMSAPRNGLHVWRYMSKIAGTTDRVLRALVFLTPRPLPHAEILAEDNDLGMPWTASASRHQGPPPPYTSRPVSMASDMGMSVMSEASFGGNPASHFLSRTPMAAQTVERAVSARSVSQGPSLEHVSAVTSGSVPVRPSVTDRSIGAQSFAPPSPMVTAEILPVQQTSTPAQTRTTSRPTSLHTSSITMPTSMPTRATPMAPAQISPTASSSTTSRTPTPTTTPPLVLARSVDATPAASQSTEIVSPLALAPQSVSPLVSSPTARGPMSVANSVETSVSALPTSPAPSTATSVRRSRSSGSHLVTSLSSTTSSVTDGPVALQFPMTLTAQSSSPSLLGDTFVANGTEASPVAAPASPTTMPVRRSRSSSNATAPQRPVSMASSQVSEGPTLAQAVQRPLSMTSTLPTALLVAAPVSTTSTTSTSQRFPLPGTHRFNVNVNGRLTEDMLRQPRTMPAGPPPRPLYLAHTPASSVASPSASNMPDLTVSDEEFAAHLHAEQEIEAEQQQAVKSNETHAAQRRETDEEAAHRLRHLVLAQIEQEKNEEAARLKREAEEKAERLRLARDEACRERKDTVAGRVQNEFVRTGENVGKALDKLGKLFGKKKKGKQ